MRTFAIESTRYTGELRYTFNDKGVLVAFSAENAEIETEKLLAIISMLPPTAAKLVEMIESAQKQKTLVRFYEIVEDIPDFEKFWTKYPRKVGKLESQKAYAKMKDTEKIKAYGYLPKYQKQADKDKVAYLYPATYLNQRRWEDG